ncbi:MAG: PAS domain-containing protein, partial [Gemmatimonadota bacterium]|nr:PAS domain-containing protein [Gemmatimonadota bacterium]
MLTPPRILRWMYIGRLSVATAIFLAAVTQWQEADAATTLVAALALFGATAFTAGSAWRATTVRARVGKKFLFAQALFDLVLVTAVIHITGGAVSQFAALYILVVAAASLVLPAVGGLVLAGIGSALYVTAAMWGQTAAPALGVALQLIVFAIVALAVAYVSARLRDAVGGREELEAQLGLARLQADDILRNIGSGIITVDATSRLLYMNPTAGRLLGIDPEHGIGRPIGQTLHAVATGLAEALERAVRERVRITRGETTIATATRTFPIGLTTT